MDKKSGRLTTIQSKKSEGKLFQGGYVPPPMKVVVGPTEKKGYAPPAIKPSSPSPTNPPRKPSAEGDKPKGTKTG